MNLVFENDIPAFQHKTWQERIALHRQAVRIDRRIIFRRFLYNFLRILFLLLLFVLLRSHVLHSWSILAMIYFPSSLLLSWFYRPLWVNPLIKDALQQG